MKPMTPPAVTIRFDQRTFNTTMLKVAANNKRAARRAMTQARCQLIWGRDRLAAIADPGACPDAVAADDNAAVRAVKESALKVWTVMHALFEKQEEEDELYQQALLDCCPDEALDSLTSGTTGTNHLTPATTLIPLYDAYGIIDADTLKEAKKLLPTVLHDHSLKGVQTLVNQQNSFNDLMMAAGQAQSDHVRNQALSDLLPDSFEVYKTLYEKDHLLLANRTWLTFSAAMISASKKIRFDPSANSTTSVKLNSYDEYMAQAVSAAAAAGYTKPKYVKPPARASPPAPASFPVSQVQACDMPYCWSHGPNYSHSSAHCKKRHPNHVDTATFQNKHGGKATVWAQKQALGP